MKMEETSILSEQHTDESINERVTKLREGIKRLKFQLARLENLEESPSIPAIEITFRNNDLANKYKTSIERFLNTLLTEEEQKSVSFRILEENVENPKNQPPDNLFCIDTTSTNEDITPASDDVPYYNTVYNEILVPSNENDESFDVEPEESPASIHVKTCFNCLGNHHMKDCPEKYDKYKVTKNRKNFAMSLQNSNTRYHEDDEQKKKQGNRQPGQISSSLREALGLKPFQLPSFIYHMRILGYPPGWLQESIVESSGLNVYDSVGNAVANKDTKDTEKAANGETKYDSGKFIEYPGFNSPVPEGVIDEWRVLRMPPLQPHQQLSEAVKMCGKPSPVESVRKRRSMNSSNSETKRSKNGDSESSQNEDSRGCLETPISSPAITDDSFDAYENLFDKSSLQTPNVVSEIKTPQSTGSLSSTPGAAIVDRGNPYTKLPDLAKFSKGITEHLPYENLPGAVGTFEKMRNVLSCVRQKLTYDEDEN